MTTIDNITTTQLIHYSDNWSLEIQVGDRSDCISVSRQFHDKRKIGEIVPIKYVKGRFSGSLYIKNVG